MTVTNFVWDVLNDNVLMETDDNDEITAVYTSRPSLFGPPLSQKRDGMESYYHFDGNQSTRELTNEDGNITDSSLFSAYGEEVAKSGSTTNPFGYKGAAGYYTNEKTED